jgi:hypothetical protein
MVSLVAFLQSFPLIVVGVGTRLLVISLLNYHSILNSQIRCFVILHYPGHPVVIQSFLISLVIQNFVDLILYSLIDLPIDFHSLPSLFNPQIIQPTPIHFIAFPITITLPISNLIPDQR